jgi:hypothetical protein
MYTEEREKQREGEREKGLHTRLGGRLLRDEAAARQ